MAKTELTSKLEETIYSVTSKIGVFGCFEVTIGWNGNERVDYLTYDTNGVWRCYEIKVSKADFHSKAAHTFIGHYNYFVMPRELYEQVKDEIPNHIGVYCGYNLVKRPKRQPLGIDEQVLKDSLIRSLSRENKKFIDTGNTKYIARLNTKINNLAKEKYRLKKENIRLTSSIHDICEKYNLNYSDVRDFIRNGGTD